MRDKIIKRILIALQDGYNNKHNPDYSNNRDNNGATQEGTPYDRRGSEYLRSATRGGLLSDTRYSLPDMPFFEDNGDIASFEAMTPEERIATLLSEKIMNGEGEDAMEFENGKDIEAKSLVGEELHIGNEGMKALDYFSVSAPIAEAQNNQELISATNIIQNFQIQRLKQKILSSPPRWMLPTLKLWSVVIWLPHSVWLCGYVIGIKAVFRGRFIVDM